MADSENRVRWDVLFKGHVQGVGFRFTTSSVARRFDVTGFVKNLASGDVQVVAEGSPGELKRFVEGIADAMAGHIRDTKRDERPATGEFADFRVRH